MNNQFVFMKCTGCGAELQADPAQECTVCQFCGQPFVTQKGIQNFNAAHGFAQGSPEPQAAQYAAPPAKKAPAWLWVLGWLLVFPVPLTILMLRSKKIPQKVRYGIIAGGWLVYLLIVIVPRLGGDKKPSVQPEPSAVVTTEAEERVMTASPETELTAAMTTAAQTTAVQTTAVTTAAETVTATAAVTTSATTESTKKELSAEEIKKLVNGGDFSLVTPKFKQEMDAYEKFYDDYIAFMKKYTSGNGDMMSMLNDYMTMLDNLQKWSDTIDAIDESKLTPADDAYFLLVTLRVENKLLKAAIK